MPKARTVQLPHSQFDPLIDSQIVYPQGRPLPLISLWGFSRIFCTSQVFPQEIISGFQNTRNKEQRLHFLKALFGGTSVDPWKSIFKGSIGESARNNRLTELWHLKWKYGYTPGCFLELAEKFHSNPRLALDGVKCNLEKMQINRKQASDVSIQIFEDLYPGCLNGFDHPEAVRVVAVLSLLCLLGGDDIVEKDKFSPCVQDWISNKTIHAPLPQIMPRNTGLYHVEAAQIDKNLLPSIKCNQKTYYYRENLGSPLHQIIEESQYPWLLLTGQNDAASNSAVSGAGKTTSLRFLAMETEGGSAFLLPLAEIYTSRNEHSDQTLYHYIEKRYHININELTGAVLLLFDGLDELIGRKQLEQFSEDLSLLQQTGRIGLVVSSKFPWTQLPKVDVFYQWLDVWHRFQSCTILTLSEKQIEAAVSEPDASVPLSLVNTPFLLSLYLHTFAQPEDPWTLHLIHRWRADNWFQSRALTKENLFYYSLIVQAIRWSESARGQKVQWEKDVFLLFHTLPAIAYQMFRRDEGYPAYDPAARVKTDQAFVERMIYVTWQATMAGLYLFPGYSLPESGIEYEHLLFGLNFEKFMAGAASSLLHGKWTGEDQFSDPHFINHSLQEQLAYLHIANTFLLAYNGKLDTTIEALEAYGHTIELLAAQQLEQTAAFFDLITPGDKLYAILAHGPDITVSSPLSRFLAGHIGATLCEHIPSLRKDKSISPIPWFECMILAFDQLERSSNAEMRRLVQDRLGQAYIFGQTRYALNFRRLGKYTLAKQCGDQVLKFQARSGILNSDGNHIKALALLDQVQLILNNKYKPENQENIAAQISEEECVFADHLLACMECHMNDTTTSPDLLPFLSSEQKNLLPIFVEMLGKAKQRLNAYASDGFSGEPMLKFICMASYVAKAYSISAALSPGNSGAAYNLLGSLAANNSEELENNKKLPFFRKNPKLYLDIPELTYRNRSMASFRIYHRVYGIRKGIQPYSARRLCELLLRKQVRLSDD